jgi:hypothetical protein
MTKPEILVIERVVGIAHPSYASGGYVVLTSGATAYRNADMVAADPGTVVAWCIERGCEITPLPDQDPSCRRRHVRFPNEAVLAEFKNCFPRKPR